MNKIKDNTMNFIVDEALKLFIQKSIVDVKMSEIAKEVGIGDATLYRYFKKKQNIVLAAAVKLSEYVTNDYFIVDDSKCGFEQVKQFYEAYLKVFQDHKEYFKFIYELDAYLVMETNIDKVDYEEEVYNYKEIFLKAYNQGVLDKSLKPLADLELFYYSTTHTLLSLCKSLAGASVLGQDINLRREEEISMVIDIILKAL